MPLYTEQDAQAALHRFTPREFDEGFEPIPGVHVQMHRAGHLLGAASVRVEWEGRSILFSGDLGRANDLLMVPPALPDAADTVVIESTYGDRTHADVDPLTELAAVINRTAARYPAGIISASGMASGGRVLHHLKAFAPDPRNSIVFAGFQARARAVRPWSAARAA